MILFVLFLVCLISLLVGVFVGAVISHADQHDYSEALDGLRRIRGA